MHHLVHCFQNQVKLSNQNVSYCTRKRPCFHLFLTVPNRFKYRKNACLRYIYFSEVLNRFKYRHNACVRCTLFSSISLQFQTFSNTFRAHALKTLFSKCSRQFQIIKVPSECMLQRHCFQNLSLQFQIVSNTAIMHALDTLFSIIFLKF